MITVKLTEKLTRQTYSRQCQTFKIESFAKRIMPARKALGSPP